MSLILDALNRADRERKNTDTTPDINTVHEFGFQPPGKPKAKIVVMLISVVLLLAGLWFAYQFLRNRSVSDASAQQTATHLPASAQSSVSRSVASTNGNRSPATTNEGTAKTTTRSAASSIATISESESAINSLYADSDDGQLPKTENQVSDLYKEPEESPVVQSVPIAPQTITPVTLVEDAAPAASTDNTVTTTTASAPAISTKKNYAALKNIPDLSELPVSFQQEIPSMLYTQHNFSADGISNVMINGRPRLARTVIADNLSLDEIYVDGILLRFRERKFKLRALNSWVNM